MPAASLSSVVRSILSGNATLSADEVIKKAKLRGVTAPDDAIRKATHNVKSEMKRAAAKAVAKPSSPKPVPAAARATKTPEPAPTPATPREVAAAPAPAALPSLDLSSVLANVALVNAVVGACGGADPARKVAEAVAACGGVEAFLQHLDLVAQVRG